MTTRVVAAVSPALCTQAEGKGEGASAIGNRQSAIGNEENNPLPSPLTEYREGEPESNVAVISPTDLDGIWRMLLQLLGAKSSATPALLQGAKLVGIEDGMAIVRFAHDHDAVVRMLDRNGKKDAIRQILAQLLHQNVGVKFELEGPPPGPERESAQPEPRAVAVRRSAPPPAASAPLSAPSRITPEMKEALRADPLVAAVMQHLGGEIVKVE
jgi:hypothetical protein